MLYGFAIFALLSNAALWWIVFGGVVWIGWLHVLYQGPIRVHWINVDAVIYVLAIVQIVNWLSFYPLKWWLEWRPNARKTIASNAESKRKAEKAKIVAEYQSELDAIEPPTDSVREAMSNGMTDADLIDVCNTYKVYVRHWRECFANDPSEMDHPLKPFPLWWHCVCDPEGAEMEEYAEYLNRREEVIQLGYVPEYTCLTFNEWKERTNIHEQFAYLPSSFGLRRPDGAPINRPYHPNFYHRPAGFYVTEPTR